MRSDHVISVRFVNRIDSTLLYAGGNSREFHNSELIGLYEEVIEGVSIK